MNANYIRPIPKRIEKRILSYDAKHEHYNGLRFYAYLTTIQKELVKITVLNSFLHMKPPNKRHKHPFNSHFLFLNHNIRRNPIFPTDPHFPTALPHKPAAPITFLTYFYYCYIAALGNRCAVKYAQISVVNACKNHSAPTHRCHKILLIFRTHISISESSSI